MLHNEPVSQSNTEVVAYKSKMSESFISGLYDVFMTHFLW